MNFQDLELALGKLQTRKKNATKIAPFVALAILFTLIPIYYPNKFSQVLSSSLVPLQDNVSQKKEYLTSREEQQEKIIISSAEKDEKSLQTNLTKSDSYYSVAPQAIKKCDLFSGEWIPNPEGPYYTNMTCFQIQEHQNCMKYGRPDTGFLKWKWKPDDCELPIFDPRQFLELVRDKSLAFIGDSVARNHMQSLICLLSRVTSRSSPCFVI
ncbi:PREDICTED: protein trichome birefringence-like 20 [Nicotiana attenuata]|uniref:Protein trichome birefringence-like 20 n=1 Tax=Nicotiana attenuata TaxID=49451 RepID=A0A314LCW3_NICAT|nr:PREDICTED: protein trichome birefringence-like 20 [Nicotiana attenuata]OIT38899.1 protein trichome birefringence-like 20 [Nicotiana attenuata]